MITAGEITSCRWRAVRFFWLPANNTYEQVKRVDFDPGRSPGNGAVENGTPGWKMRGAFNWPRTAKRDSED